MITLQKDYSMKIGLDFHGVITDNPKFFSEFTNNIRSEIHILTGERITKKFVNQLHKWNISFDFLFSILDYHIKNKTTRAWQDERGWWIKKDIWNCTKAWYCKTNKIDLHIDDSDDYGKYFVTPYLRYYTKGSLPLLSSIVWK